jgi:2-haloacid dehalogenase
MAGLRPKIVTFDVYMALLDIQGSLVPVFADALGLSEADAGPMVRLWRAKQMELAAISNSLGQGRRSFRECTRLGLDYVLASNGLDLGDQPRRDLVIAWDRMNPWPEAKAVVAEVKRRGYTTAILSNGDQDMLDAVAGDFGADMDYVLSSETAGFYKPHPAVYQLPARVLDIAVADTLHVAGSPNDVLGAGAFGMTCYWSNRAADRVLDPAFAPAYEGRNLTGVLELLEG